MDVRRSLLAAIGPDTQSATEYMRVVGAIDSYLEGATFDVLFGHELGASASAISVLQKASRQNIKLYKVTAQNANVLNTGLAGVAK